MDQNRARIWILGRFQLDLLDFQSEWAENGLELMAKDMRTQPTSQNSIPTSQNLDFDLFVCARLCLSRVLEPQTVFL